MNLSFAQLKPHSTARLDLSKWEAVRAASTTLVAPVPVTLGQAGTIDVQSRSRLNAMNVMMDNKHAVFLSFAHACGPHPSRIDVKYLKGYVDLASRTAEQLGKALGCAVIPAPQMLVAVEKTLLEIEDHAVVIHTADSNYLAELSDTSMDNGGAIYVYTIDPKRLQYQEGLSRFNVADISSISQSEILLKTLQS